jgi:transposase IS116/IS110/IS902 family protein/winged helix domain-containing protein
VLSLSIGVPGSGAIVELPNGDGMASAPPREPDRVVGRLRAAVAMRIATGPDANDASAALPVSPHVAWEAIDDAAVDARGYADRVTEAARLLDLDDLSVDVLWLSALAEFGARYSSVFAFLNEDATRRLPTPQLIASVLADDDVQSRAVLARVAGGPLRRNGCLRVLDADQTLPLSEQPIRLAPELASFLLGVSHDTPADGGLLRVDVPEHPMGRADAVARIRAAFALPGKAHVLVAGPDAVEVSALALGRGLVLADARAGDETDVLARTLLVAGLESRAACLHRVDPTALGLCAETGDWRRFDHPDSIASYVGLVPSDHSSGNTRRLGKITKAGATHARRLLVEAAPSSTWKYMYRPQEGSSPGAVARALRPWTVTGVVRPSGSSTWTSPHSSLCSPSTIVAVRSCAPAAGAATSASSAATPAAQVPIRRARGPLTGSRPRRSAASPGGRSADPRRRSRP